MSSTSTKRWYWTRVVIACVHGKLTLNPCRAQSTQKYNCVQANYSLFPALGQWGRSKKWAGNRSGPPLLFTPTPRSLPAFFCDRPHWPRAWNTLYNCMSYWPSVMSRWLILTKFFLCVFMDRDVVAFHKHAKKKQQKKKNSHLDRTSLVNKGFIIWLSGEMFLAGHGG